MNKLLAIRISNADEGIDRTDKALAKAIARAGAINQLPRELQAILIVNPWMSTIEAFIAYCKKFLAALPENLRPSLEMQVTGADSAYAQMNSGLQEISKRLPFINRSAEQVEQVNTYRTRTVALLQEKRRKLDEIRDNAQKPRNALLALENEKFLWGEHIETIAGMILRDEQFDNGLCVLADQLIGICRGYTPFGTIDTLNVLGRDTAALREMRDALYFKFPAWSVWGLALVAHDFWHASSARVHDSMKTVLTGIPGAEELWKLAAAQYCLADAFATYVIGPAYALACILLVLNIDSVQDRPRAESIFATLDSLAGQKPAAYAFVPTVKESWSEAADLDLPVPLEDAGIPRLREALVEFMPEALRYNADAWLSHGEELNNLLQSDPEKGDWNAVLEGYRVPDEVDLRHVLHAVWLCRWNDPADTAPEQAAERTKNLAERAEKLCHKVAKARERRSIATDDVNGSSSTLRSTLIQRLGMI